MTKPSYKQWIAACTLTSTLLLGACGPAPVTRDASIVPLPNQIQQSGNAFVLTPNTTIGTTDPELQPAAQYLKEILSAATGYDLQVKEGKGTITLAKANIEGKEGAYTLSAKSDRIDITGNSYGGVIAGIESLRQLFPPQIESKQIVDSVAWVIPTAEIQDAPRFEWRGIMLDVSRHFYTKEEVKELLDLMALYKMNKFHWHLTDDQGWRIEIKKYPLLTEKGAWRTFNSHDRSCMKSAKSEDNPDFLIPENKLRIVEGDTLYGGYYTQEDIKEVIEYAKVRGIDIVPEIDMPGHMLAAVSNYSGVACTDKVGWGTTFSSPVCPGKESAMEFCKNVYSELIDLFPYKYVHIGGDEVEKANWKKCPDCQKRMRDNHLKTEEELQSWFIHDMEKFFNAKGKEMIGWDEKYPRKDMGNGKVRAVGLAMAMQGSAISGVDVGSVTIKVNDDGFYSMTIGAADMGTGCDTTLAQVAAECLDCELDDIVVYGVDTDISPYDSGSYASSTAYLTGMAVVKTCESLKKKILKKAAEYLNCSEDELEFAGKTVRRLNAPEGEPAEITLKDIGNRAMCFNEEALQATESHSSPVSPPPFMAGAAEVEIDKETGHIELLQFAAAVDCGTPLNENLARVQTEGGLAQGIGMAMYEDVTYSDHGRVHENSFMQYKVPSRLDIGKVQVEFECSYEPTGPFGAKSIGEIVINTPSPAIANAVYNAVGVRIRELPITDEKIFIGIMGGR